MADQMNMDDIMKMFGDVFGDIQADQEYTEGQQGQNTSQKTTQPAEAPAPDDDDRELTPDEIKESIKQAYDHYNAGNHQKAKQLLDRVLDQEGGDTPANAKALIALMCYHGHAYEQSTDDAYAFARLAHLGNMKLGTYVLARIYADRGDEWGKTDQCIALELCRQLGDYPKAQSLRAELERKQLPSYTPPELDVTYDGSGHNIWDAVTWAYARTQQGDAEAAWWCGRQLLRKRFRRWVSDQTLLDVFETAAKDGTLCGLEAKLFCAQLCGERQDWKGQFAYYLKAFEQRSDDISAGALASAYKKGRGVEANEQKARYYAYQQAKWDFRHRERIFATYHLQEQGEQP